MIPILYLYFIINKKQKAINLRQKYFHSYDTYTLLTFYYKQKATSNKFTPEIFKSKKFLETKGTRNESTQENYFLIVYKHTVKYIITLNIPK